MAVANFAYQGAIGERYNGQELAMAREQAQAHNFNQTNYPIQCSEVQFRAIPHVNRVLQIMVGRVTSPLELARINAQGSDTLKKIEFAFMQAQANYRDTLYEAIRLDNRTIEDLKTLPNNWFKKIFTRCWRACSGHQKKVLQDGSAHRYAWMISAGTQEQQRIAQAQQELQGRINLLARKLQIGAAEGSFERGTRQELDNCYRLWQVMMGTPCRAQIEGQPNRDVAQLLADFQG